MPLLAKEPCLSPETLFAEGAFDLDGAPWWALYTFPRREKVLVRKLLVQDQRFYCPLVAKRHRSVHGKVRTAYVPLFTNYVFLQGDEHSRYMAACTGQVVRFIPIVETELFLEQIRSLRQMIDSNVAIEVEARLAVGKFVRVKSGPLRGRQGQIVQERKRELFVVNIPLLGQSVATLVDGWELEPV